MSSIDRLVEEIRLLTPPMRRRLMSRLRINGLLEGEELLSDQNPLDVAPALGLKRLEAQRRKVSTKLAPVTDVRLAPVPMGGKVVVGAPDRSSPEDNPIDSAHAMAPVPGQAPEEPIRIVFDGGSKGNPGYGYGSYALEWPGEPRQIVRLQLGNSITNNEAEYDTLIIALEAVLTRLQSSGADPGTAQLDIRGDSQLVIQQVIGTWKCSAEKLKRRRNKAKALLARFEKWQLQHHMRHKSVEILGH